MKKQTKIDKFMELVDEYDEEMLYPMGHEDAIVGILERFGQQPLIVLDKRKIIATLKRDGMTEDEAEEFFQFNIVGAWMGEGTPGFVTFIDDLV